MGFNTTQEQNKMRLSTLAMDTQTKEWRKRIKGEYNGTFQDNRARILSIRSESVALVKKQMLRMTRREFPKHLTDILEAQILAKFGQAELGGKKLKALLASGDKHDHGATYKMISADIMDALQYTTMGSHEDLETTRALMKMRNDREFVSMVRAAASQTPSKAVTFTITALMIRPSLTAGHKDDLFKQLKNSEVTPSMLLRFVTTVSEAKFIGFTNSDVEALIDKVLNIASKSYATEHIPQKGVDCEGGRVLEPYRVSINRMQAETLPIILSYAAKVGINGVSADSTSIPELLSKAPSDLTSSPMQKLLAYVLMYMRLSVPSLVKKKGIIFWQPEFRWGIDFSEKFSGTQDETFAYHGVFELIPEVIGKFDFGSEGFKKALHIAGNEDLIRLIAFSFLYQQKYKELIRFVKIYGSETNFLANPALYFARAIAQYRMGELAEATESAIMIFEKSLEKGWKEEDKSRYFHSKHREKFFNPSEYEHVYIIPERDAAYIACQLMFNLIRAAWRDETNSDLYYATLFMLCHVDFETTGRKTFDLLNNSLRRTKFNFPTLLEHLGITYFVLACSNNMRRTGDLWKCCSQQEERKGAATRNKNKIQVCATEKVLFTAATSTTTNEMRAFPWLRKFLKKYLDDIIKGIV